MKNTRAAGVLMHITSLPSPYGVGVFGEETKRFIEFLSDMKFTYWQVLPFVPTDEMNSPYCSPSSFAGNELFPVGSSVTGFAPPMTRTRIYMAVRPLRRILPLLRRSAKSC